MASVAVDSKLSTFYSLCQQIEFNSSLSVKQEIIAGFLLRYKGDVGLLFKHLLPKFNGRLYHLQDKQLVKLLAPLIKVPEPKLMQHVKNSGCIAKSVQHYFRPHHPDLATSSALTLEDLDDYLNQLGATATEEAQRRIFSKFLSVASPIDVFVLLRQIKQDLRLGAGIRVVLAGLHPAANAIYKQCADIQKVVQRVLLGETDVAADEEGDDGGVGSRSQSPGAAARGDGLVASISLNTPLSPMLAAPSKGLDHVLSKCPNGAYSETKYDGERIQIHKDGAKWHFFARSLKQMKPDKYEGLDTFLHDAVKANSCILDGEILLVDLATGKPLPFGTLGKHKKAKFSEACTCIFLFDIMFFNGRSVINEPMDVRRALLREAVKFIPNRIMLSEMREIVGTPDQRAKALRLHLAHAITEGLEGLVCKDIKSTYSPGGRYWIKLKKDYLEGMADSADLVVLGAYYGSGNKGGVLSTFLMGVCDKSAPPGSPKRFKTVCKVGNGHDDATLEALNKKYKDFMVACDVPPPWIDVHNSHKPDVYVKDPMLSDVWEIIGAEFSKTNTHTAGGVSLRFPRVTKIRDDKDVNSATSLDELLKLVAASKQKFEQKGFAMANEDDDGGQDAARGPSPAAPYVRPARVAEILAETAAAASGSGGGSVAFAGEVTGAVGRPVPAPVTVSPGPPMRVATAAPPAPAAPAATAPAASAHTVPNDGGSYDEVPGDAAQPILQRNARAPNIVIAHSVSQNGKWSNRGAMGSISKYVGDEPGEEYNKMAAVLKHGNVQFVEVSNRTSSAKMYVATLVAQDSNNRHQIVHDAFVAGLEKCCGFAAKHNASLHVSKPDTSVCGNWSAVAKFLKAAAVRHGVAILVYDRGLMRQGSVLPASHSAGASSALSSLPTPPAEFTRVGSTATSTTTPLPQHRETPSHRLDVSPSPSAGLGSAAKTTLFDENFLEGTRVAVVGFSLRDEQVVKQKAQMMGCVIVDSTDRATHVVVDGGSAPLNITGSALAVKRQWVDDCFAQNKQLPTAAYQVTRSSPAAPQSIARDGTTGATGSFVVFEALKGCSVVVNGFGDEERAELEGKIRMLGGTVAPKWTVVGSLRTTHMVTATLDSAAQRASELGGSVVSRKWVDDSLRIGRAQDVRRYVFDDQSSNNHSSTAAQQQHRHLQPAAVLPPPPPPHAQDSVSGASKRKRVPSPVASASSTETEIEIEDAVVAVSPTLLKGQTFVIEGYGADDTAAIRAKIEKMGGTVVPAPAAASCTNVICDTLTSITHRIADRDKVLRRAWVADTFRRGTIAPKVAYRYFATRLASASAGADRLHVAPGAAIAAAHKQPASSGTESYRAASVASATESYTQDDEARPANSPGSTVLVSTDDDELPKKHAKADVPPPPPPLPPTVLDGMLIAVAACDSTAKRSMQRYVVAFGGEVIELDGSAVEARLRAAPPQACIVIVAATNDDALVALSTVRKSPIESRLRAAAVVNKDWLWASIREGKVLPTAPFTITFE